MARPGPVVYKCKNIIDVQTKRFSDRDSLPRAEAVLHICDDPKSSLFQAALQRPDLVPQSSGKRSSSALSTISQWDTRPVASDEVRHLFMSMARATHFPATKGREYSLNFGDLGGAVWSCSSNLPYGASVSWFERWEDDNSSHYAKDQNFWSEISDSLRSFHLGSLSHHTDAKYDWK